MDKIVLDVALFRAQFPAFADPAKYPDSLLLLYWDEVRMFIDDHSYGMLGKDPRTMAMHYLLAHFLALAQAVQRGKQGGYVTSSTVDNVTVTKLAPPAKDQFDWWLNQTAYGQQLLALLTASTVGGYYVGNNCESAAYRKGWGIF